MILDGFVFDSECHPLLQKSRLGGWVLVECSTCDSAGEMLQAFMPSDKTRQMQRIHPPEPVTGALPQARPWPEFSVKANRSPGNPLSVNIQPISAENRSKSSSPQWTVVFDIISTRSSRPQSIVASCTNPTSHEPPNHEHGSQNARDTRQDMPHKTGPDRHGDAGVHLIAVLLGLDIADSVVVAVLEGHLLVERLPSRHLDCENSSSEMMGCEASVQRDGVKEEEEEDIIEVHGNMT